MVLAAAPRGWSLIPGQGTLRDSSISVRSGKTAVLPQGISLVEIGASGTTHPGSRTARPFRHYL